MVDDLMSLIEIEFNFLIFLDALIVIGIFYGNFLKKLQLRVCRFLSSASSSSLLKGASEFGGLN